MRKSNILGVCKKTPKNLPFYLFNNRYMNFKPQEGEGTAADINNSIKNHKKTIDKTTPY